MVCVSWREAEARPGTMVQIEEFILIVREIRSHWKVLRRKVTVSH